MLNKRQLKMKNLKQKLELQFKKKLFITLQKWRQGFQLQPKNKKTMLKGSVAP